MGVGDHWRVRKGAETAQFAGAVEFAVMVLALVVIALLRRHPRLAVVVGVVPILASLSAEALKQLTAAPRGTTVVAQASCFTAWRQPSVPAAPPAAR